MANATLNREEKKAIAGRVGMFEKLSTWRLADVHCRFANRLETALSPYSRKSLVMQSSVIATILAGRGVPEPEIATICPTCDVETEGPGCEWCGWGDTHEMNDIATDFEQWMEYMDPDGIMTEDEFDSLTVEEKLELIREAD